MRQVRFFLAGAHRKRLAVLLLCALIFFGAGSLAKAQSGRRVPKRSEAPPVQQPPAESEPPAPPPANKPETPQLPLLVMNYSPSLNIPVTITRLVVGSCVERFKESSAITVSVEGKEMNRKEASDRAKSEKETYVVWLQLEQDVADSDRAALGRVNPANILVSYVVFMPGTGKTKSQGRVYLRPYQPNVGIGGVGVPLPIPPGTPVPATSSQLENIFRQAGYETADRVMSSLNIIPPPARTHP